MKRFRIYLPFAVNEIKTQMAYKGAFYLFIFISTFSSFISYFLWSAIYGSSQNAILGGLCRDEMTVYIFMVYVTSSVVSISISEWVSEDVVKGTVAMQLIKPIDYRLSLIARALGQMVYRFILPAVFIWVGLELYKFFVLGLSFTPIANVALYILSCLMSFLTGQLIPLSFFPEVIQRIFDFLPFSSMIYAPVMIYLGKYQGAELAWVLLRQGAWVLILYGIGTLIWRRVTKRLVVLGG